MNGETVRRVGIAAASVRPLAERAYAPDARETIWRTRAAAHRGVPTWQRRTP